MEAETEPYSNTKELPILLIVFRRVDTLEKVFDSLGVLKPKKLYIASDAARNHLESEIAKVDTVRKFALENITWPCEVKTLFQEKNLGCKYNPQKAITWFFQHEELGIILEDDCVPSQSFYFFCNELLAKYKNDQRVFGITGTHVMEPYYPVDVNDSYYFREYIQTWGWATWRNRWEIHLSFLENFDDHLSDTVVSTKLQNKVANRQIIHQAKISHNNQLDAWDYQWFFTVFANNGLFIVPKKNLIYNIGFGEDATHTFNASRLGTVAKEIEFPLKHPINMVPNLKMDNLFYKRHYAWRTWWQKITSFGYVRAAVRARTKRILGK